jgi:type 1 fimbria pilin
MNKKVLAAGVILVLAAVLYAQDTSKVTIEGYIIDNACAGSHMTEPTFSDRVKKHSTSCALMPNCVESGYAVLTADKKLYKLDKAGNESAEALLRNTETKAGVAVTIEGTIDGDTIKVTKISEKTE